MRDDTAPQIGSYDVDRDALTGEGEPLGGLLAALGLPADTLPADTPEAGWRVLAEARSDVGSVLLGSPADPDRRSWHVAQVSTGHSGRPPRVAVHPDVQPLRRSVAERRAGLVLRWPPITRDLLDVDALAVDIVNEGADRWLPEGGPFHAVASLVPADGPAGSFYFGWASGRERPLPLDPGEYVRVPAPIDSSQWRDARPGPYRIHAFEPSLRMTTVEPLVLELTPELIAAHRPEPLPPAAAADRDRRATEDRLRHVRAYLAARERFPELAAAIRDARDDDDALGRIGRLLGIGDEEAGAVYSMQLRRLRAGDHDVLAGEIESLERRLRELG